MRAVNLIPSESRGRGAGTSIATTVPTYLVLGLLAIGVAFVTLYVLTNNKISDRRAQLTTLQAEVAQAQAQSERFASYAQFATLAQSRAGTVRGLASNRFDWHAVLADLAKVVPANTSLQSLNGSTTGTTGAGSAAATPSSSGNGSSGPAVELVGCTQSQDDVAQLMSRLRLIDGVTNVTLASSQKQSAGQGGTPASTSASTPAGTSGASATGCGPNTPTFDLKVQFQGASGSASATSSTARGAK